MDDEELELDSLPTKKHIQKRHYIPCHWWAIFIYNPHILQKADACLPESPCDLLRLPRPKRVDFLMQQLLKQHKAWNLNFCPSMIAARFCSTKAEEFLSSPCLGPGFFGGAKKKTEKMQLPRKMMLNFGPLCWKCGKDIIQSLSLVANMLCHIISHWWLAKLIAIC